MGREEIIDLDLRFNAALAPEIGPLFNRMAYELRSEFNDLVAKFSAPHRDNLDWWVQGPASRNTLASPFFHYFCCIHFVHRLLANGDFRFTRVVVDSRALGTILSKVCADNAVAGCGVIYMAPPIGTRRRIKRALASPALLLFKISQCVIARSTRRWSYVLPDRALVVIDTFIMPGYETSDRWYGSLWENLPDAARAATFFVPTVVATPLRKMSSMYRGIRHSARNFMLKEDYVTLADILFAVAHPRRLAKMTIDPVTTLGYDVSGLVREEMATDRDPVTTVESLLTYRFVHRLRQHGVRVRLAIDWFEGQVIDKAWNLAFKRYYPEAKRVGYRAFESFPFYLCSYPTEAERVGGVAPDTIAVQGRATSATVREFLPDLDVMVIPSFKAQYVWDHEESRLPGGEFTVLVALPISIHASVRILRQVIDAWSSLGEKALCRFVVKAHPTVSVDELKARVEMPLHEAVQFTPEKSFARAVRQSHLLVTEASSTCLEALACGIPVVIVENDQGLTYDPVPTAIPREAFRRVSSSAELVDAMLHYSAFGPEELQRQQAFGRQIRRDYFERVTPEGVARFLNFPMTSN